MLALEPECAAIHCQSKVTVAGKGVRDVAKAKSYTVIDVGGGTANIASHEIVDGQIAEIAPPAGNLWGGITVNEKFSEFLQDFVDDPEFSSYIKNISPENQAQHEADLNKLLYTTFEKQKKRFCSVETQDSYIVELPRSFWSLYEDPLVKKGKTLNSEGDMSVEIEDDDHVMRISDSKMAKFFQPAIKGITELIESHLQQNTNAHKVDTIYWVGGFGGCKYLRNKLEMFIKETFQGCNYNFVVPPEPELAVLLGATTFHCDPSIVAERKADADEGTVYNRAQDNLGGYHSFGKYFIKLWNTLHLFYYCTCTCT